jgi:hypothetical protein
MEPTMSQGIADLLSRSAPTLLEDSLGVSALAVLLYVGLALPGLF